MSALARFEVGKAYPVWRLDDAPASVTVVARDAKHVHTACGRKIAPVLGIGPGGDIEVLRLDEDGPVARGGIARADSEGATP